MSGSRATYLDSSAIVKLVVKEAESTALRRFLRRKQPLVASALARTEVTRAVLGFDAQVQERASDVLRRIDLVRVTDRILRAAGSLLPPELRSLDAIHLVTALEIGVDLARVCTYDERMRAAAETLGLRVVAPA